MFKDKTKAIIKVAWDKMIDNVIYVFSFSWLENKKNNDLNLDGIINLDNYADYMNNKRIRKDTDNLGFWTEMNGFFSEPTYIIDNIYLGSAFNAASKQSLDKNNIKIIINMTKELSLYYPQDYEYYKCELYDNNKDSISEHLENIYLYIKKKQEELKIYEIPNVISLNEDDNEIIENVEISYDDVNKFKKYKGNILLHCYMGASRSATIVLYYLLRSGTCENLDEAIEYLIKKRPHVNPTFRMIQDIADNTTDK